ncbi:MAG: MBL fold metallo-hydrolase [Clostridiales Family XIII bacterium]|nr:MBL fold metallo-hydrolase [Clostridiales Family XIII bacterium]
MKIKFCGAAEGVTGSCHLITAGTEDAPLRILLDCGELQGGRSIEEQNSEPFPFDPTEVDCAILSHAHIDHCGRLPLLVKRGYGGKIFCTEATADLLGIMLRDGAHIHEKEAEWKTRKALRAGRDPVEPLYTMQDAEEVLKHVIPVRYDETVTPADGFRFALRDAGHIIGSAIVELWLADGTGSGAGEKKIVFSGDLGQSDRPMLNDPTFIKEADCVIMESTYGNRIHEHREDSDKLLADVFIETTERGGTVVIPSFAVGRAQDLIYEFNDFYENNAYYARKLKDVKMYIDSPMAIAATEVFKRNAKVFDEEYKEKVREGDDPLDFINLQFTKTAEESKRLNESDEPKVIISASGMCEAGRIRHHLKHHLWRGKDAVVFVGYQAVGTLGRDIVDGAKSVKLFGDEVRVNAHIYNLEGFSAHADHDGLMAWVKGFEEKPERFFLVHGELQSKKDLARDIERETGIAPTVVEHISEFEV